MKEQMDQYLVSRIKNANAKRIGKEINLLDEVSLLIRDHKGEVFQTYFLAHDTIKSAFSLKPDVQIVALMSYFTEILLKFKAYTNISITQPMDALYKNTDVADWYTLFSRVVFGFIVTQNVFETVIINDSKLVEETEA